MSALRMEIGWKRLGEEPDFGSPVSAALLRDVGGKIVVRAHIGRHYSVTEEFYVWHSNNAGTSYPWRVSRRFIVGSRHAVDSIVDLDEFSRFDEAMAEAKRLARAALGKAARS